MPLHRSHGDVEKDEISYTPPKSDGQNASIIEFLEYPSYKNSQQFKLGGDSYKPEEVNFQGTFVLNCGLALRTRSLTGGWENCWPFYLAASRFLP